MFQPIKFALFTLKHYGFWVKILRVFIENLSGDRLKTINFYMPDDASRRKVIEIWRKEKKERLHVHNWLSVESYKVEVEEERLLKNTKTVSY